MLTKYNEYINILKKHETELTNNICFEIAQFCSKNLYSERELDNESARSVLIYVINNFNRICIECKDIFIDLFESAGFYPYLEKYKDEMKLTSTASMIRKEYYHSDNLKLIYLHDEQKILLDKIKKGINLVVSAPTSFGKSLLIEEIIASKQYKNIVIIQPTLALLDETRKKLKKYSNDFKILVRTSQEIDEKRGNIFLFTAERVLEYKKFPSIDFLVLDEFYKLSTFRDDERADILNNAFYFLLKFHKVKFLLLGPNIEKISPGFEKQYNAEFYRTKYSLVVNESIDIYKDHEGKFGSRGAKKEYKEEVLFNLLHELKDEQTIIYCSSPARVRYLANKYANFLLSNDSKNKKLLPLIEWARTNIDTRWYLLKELEIGIGIHDAALPRHVSSSIIEYFNGSELNCLFCTTTIIEGVNTNSKNIIFYDNTKGKNTSIDFFDYSNIKGRSGRMMVHLIGKIYNFNLPPKKETITIDIPFFEQNPISDEVLINIEDADIKNQKTEQASFLKEISGDLKSIIKSNGVSVRGQLNIIRELESGFDVDLITWSSFPKYEQLEYILHLAWGNLLKPSESTNPITCKSLCYLSFKYAQEKNIKGIIDDNYLYAKQNNPTKDDNELYNDSIREVFQILRHWFEYKVPKWLSVVHHLQEYVCNKKGIKAGNYLYFAGLIENSFIQENLTLLLEYNIPSSAIQKLQKHIPSSINEDNLKNYIIENKLQKKSSLTTYENHVLEKNL